MLVPCHATCSTARVLACICARVPSKRYAMPIKINPAYFNIYTLLAPSLVKYEGLWLSAHGCWPRAQDTTVRSLTIVAVHNHTLDMT